MNLTLEGECLACKKIAACNDVTLERVISSYTCPLFEGAPEPVYLARLKVITTYGEKQAIIAILEANREA